MSDDTTTTVICAECKANLPVEHAGSKVGSPCPNCGSTEKHIHFELRDEMRFEIHDSLRGKVKNVTLPSSKNPRVKFFSGDDLRKSDGKWMQKEMVVDRDNNLYKELVTDPQTGEVIRDCEEALSDHVGHGDAKFKKDCDA